MTEKEIEELYKQTAKETAPDLWGKIEPKLVPHAVLAETENGPEDVSAAEKKPAKAKKVIRFNPYLAAAAACLVLMAGLAVITMTVKNTAVVYEAAGETAAVQEVSEETIVLGMNSAMPKENEAKSADREEMYAMEMAPEEIRGAEEYPAEKAAEMPESIHGGVASSTGGSFASDAAAARAEAAPAAQGDTGGSDSAGSTGSQGGVGGQGGKGADADPGRPKTLAAFGAKDVPDLWIPDGAARHPVDEVPFSEEALAETTLLCEAKIGAAELVTDENGITTGIRYYAKAEKVSDRIADCPQGAVIRITAPIIENADDPNASLYQMKEGERYLLPLKRPADGDEYELIHPYSPQIMLFDGGVSVFHVKYAGLCDQGTAPLEEPPVSSNDPYTGRLLSRLDGGVFPDLEETVIRQKE